MDRTIGLPETAHAWSLYLFDPEDRRWRRPWAEMLPDGFQDVGIESWRFVHHGKEASHGVVVVHASQLPDERSQFRLFQNCTRSWLYPVLISGGHQSGAGVFGSGYRRRCPVKVRLKDDEFKICFRRFWDHLKQSGDCCFELLEPARGALQVLVLLCQGYLLAHWNAARETVDFPGSQEDLKERCILALRRLGLGTESRFSGRGQVDLTPRPAWISERVASGRWWSAVDTRALRLELSAQKINHEILQLLVSEIETGKSVTPVAVLDAYELLEDHLRPAAGGLQRGVCSPPI